MRTLVGVPTYDGRVAVETALFLAEFPPADIFVVRHRPADVARNLIVHEGRRRRAEALVMIDSDCAPAAGTCDRLLTALRTGVPGVAGVPYCTAAGHVCVEAAGLTPEGMAALEGWREVDLVGCHLVGYRLESFEAIDPPYFSYGYNPNHTALTDSEDCVAHRRLRAAGVPVWCDFSSWAGHVVSRTVGKPTFLPLDLAALAATRGCISGPAAPCSG